MSLPELFQNWKFFCLNCYLQFFLETTQSKYFFTVLCIVFTYNLCTFLFTLNFSLFQVFLSSPHIIKFKFF